MKAFVAALMLGLALPVSAHAETAAAPVGDVRTDAEQLVGILLSDDSMVQLGTRAFDYGVSRGDVADARQRALYDANPGMKDYVAAKVRPEFTGILLRELPALRRELTIVVLDDMTPDEIGDTLTFFASATGMKMKAQIYQSIGDKPDQTEAELQQNAIAASMQSLTPDDYPALMAFGASSAAQKLQSVTPKISAVSQAWANKIVAANGARLRAAATVAEADFLKRAKK